MYIRGYWMSDSYAVRRYHKRDVAVPGTTRKKKYLLLFALILLAGTAGVTYSVYSSGVFLDNNPNIAPQLITRINSERHTTSLEPVRLDNSLSYQAYTKSQEVKIASLNYAQEPNTDSDTTTNIFIIPKITWALSNSDFQQQIIGSGENGGSSVFRNNIMNSRYHSVGIGVSSDSYNYYIVTMWE